MKEVCKQRMIQFGQAGNAGKIKPQTCRQMVDFYTKKK
jgi:hypothetical protein